MSLVDWIIIALVLLSTLLSIRRGFVKEALSLVTWVSAFIIARLFGAQLSTLLVDYIDSPSMRLVVAFALLFVATLIVGAMINHLIGEFVRLTGLTGTDRMFGMVFGLARGLLILIASVSLMRLTPLTGDGWWRESTLIPEVLEVEERTRELLFDLAGKSMEQI
jgi:membrane protein required for colicin V production